MRLTTIERKEHKDKNTCFFAFYVFSCGSTINTLSQYLNAESIAPEKPPFPACVERPRQKTKQQQATPSTCRRSVSLLGEFGPLSIPMEVLKGIIVSGKAVSINFSGIGFHGVAVIFFHREKSPANIIKEPSWILKKQ
ncbi:MAG: hypothetical protein JXR23_02390 [Pontiellaceae bacterium]|nr:hypothetical protein [Pontiellaceae bacterium]